MADDVESSPCMSCSREVFTPSNSRASTHLDSLLFTPERDSPLGFTVNSRPPSRMDFVASQEVYSRAGGIPQRRRRRTTTDTDFGDIMTLPRISLARSISPTRSNNPQPVGLVLQSPYNRTGEVFEIWNPELNLVERKIPQLLSHVREVNFSCGIAHPYNSTRGNAKKTKYNLQSTNHSFYQDPDTRSCLKDSLPTTRFGSSPCAAAVGIVPQVLPPLRKTTRSHQLSRP